MHLGWGQLRGELCSFPCLSWQCEHCGHTSFYGAILYRPSQTFFFFFFYKLKVFGNPTSSKSISAVFFNCVCSLHVIVSHLDHSVFLFVKVICEE